MADTQRDRSSRSGVKGNLHQTEGSISEQQLRASVRKKAACNDVSSGAEHQVRRLGSAQRAVIKAMLYELRDSAAQQDQTDRLAETGGPWRWHLADGYVIDYRPLTKQDKNTRCPKGGYLINQVVKATPAMLVYMRLKS